MYFKNISNAVIDVDGSGNFDVLKNLTAKALVSDELTNNAAHYETVTIQDGQQITTDTGIPTVGEVDVDITGSGLIQSSTSGILTLFLSFEIPLAGTQSSSCNIVCSR